LAGTNYLGVTGTNAETRDGLFTANQRVRLLDVQDGTSQTLLVGERGFRTEALDGIDDTEDSDNLRFAMWFAAVGQRRGSVGIVLGTRELNFGHGVAKLDWERDCPRGPYRFVRPGQIPDVSGSVRQACDLFHFWSWHPGGSHFLYADGSVHFLAYGADPFLQALSTRAGGEVVTGH
jgi:prepilin-type processing-associated H-X9-DG protein